MRTGKRKAQVSMEYLMFTAFILIAVALIFAFSFMNYTESLRAVKADEALARMADAVNEVYSTGRGNARFVNISFPDGMTSIEIIHRCYYGPNQGKLSECKDITLGNPATYNDIKFSAISMNLQLLAGNGRLIKETDARILEDLGELGSQNPSNPQLNKYSGVSFVAKVSWYEVLPGTWVIKLERV